MAIYSKISRQYTPEGNYEFFEEGISYKIFPTAVTKGLQPSLTQPLNPEDFSQEQLGTGITWRHS